MVLNDAIPPENQQRGGAAAKEGVRIVTTAFLSLLLPLSFLLLARLSATRYSLSATMNNHRSSFLMSVFLRSKTTLILSFLVFFVAIEALIQGLNGNKPTFFNSKRRRSNVAVALIFLMQVYLSLGIHATVEAEINSFKIGNPVLPRSVVLVLGLYEMTVLWRRSVVAPAVNEAILGFSKKSFSWAEEVMLAALFGNLWWRRLRDDAEALVVLPWVRAEMKMDVEIADAAGWLLYYLTAAIGGVRVVKFFAWVTTRICGYSRWPEEKGVNAAVNSSV